MERLKSKPEKTKPWWHLLIKTSIPWLRPANVHPKHDLSVRYQGSNTHFKAYVGYITPLTSPLSFLKHIDCITSKAIVSFYFYQSLNYQLEF
jgi:hypothetical protein